MLEPLLAWYLIMQRGACRCAPYEGWRALRKVFLNCDSCFLKNWIFVDNYFCIQKTSFT